MVSRHSIFIRRGGERPDLKVTFFTGYTLKSGCLMVEKIKKRDGREVEFDQTKIENAVFQATKAVGKEDQEISKEITTEVISYLDIFFKDEGIPSVEQIQDLVEKILIENGYADIAKAYILYREQHAKLRDTKRLFGDALDVVDSYLDRTDWRVNENSNMGFSLQGLNNHISSKITSQYWLQEVYPKEIRDLHINGDLHIHDLSLLSVYCCGWDLQDLLLTGFGGVVTKIESKPPKHFRTALMQIVNFLYSMQGESAGAQAFANFDTYLSPFIYYDNLNYREVKQAIQEFVFNMNVPTRVGFQCLSEDTEMLTPDGWKKYDEVNQGDTIKTFNLEKGIIEYKEVKKVFRKHYTGKMYNLKNRIQDQLISPGHRVVRRKFNTDNYCLDEVENVTELKSPPIIPIAADNLNEDIDLTDEEIKLIAWIISEGSLEIKGNWRRITLYQSEIKSPENYEEIIAILNILGLDFTVQEGAKSLGDTVNQIRFNAETSRKLMNLFDQDDNIKKIPEKLLEMSQEQSRIFIETYIKGDGHENCKITTSDKAILESLQHILVNAGYGFTVGKRQATGVGNKLLYILRVIRHKDTYIQEINTIEYEGVIWSVNTDNETVIAKRNGKVFITGNTPFTNITMDLNPSPAIADQPAIIGGKPMDKTLGEFQEEMDMLNKAFAEVMLEGDAKGRVFSFPIPTYNITRDFDWDNKVLDPIWEMTAKYGVPYFSNFINSDMKPEDARSMCLFPEETILYRHNKEIKKTTIGQLYKKFSGASLDNEWSKTNDTIEALSLNPETGKLSWSEITKFLKIKDNKLVSITTKDGKTMKLSANHLVAVYTERGIITKTADKITEDDFLLVLKDGSEVLNNDHKVSNELAINGNKMVGLSSIDRWDISNNEIEFIRNGDFAIVEVKDILKENLDYEQDFYDIELSKNHYFVHSDGNITHNCCRLRLDNRELRKRGGGLFGASPMTGSIGVVTLNLPRIGHLAKDENDFIDRIYKLMDAAKESLEIKRKVLERFTEAGLYPYSKFYLRDIKKRFNTYWQNHFNTIGLNGMNEALLNFLGQDIGSDVGHKFAVKIMTLMRERLIKYQEETDNMYNLEATPAEGTSYRFAKLDKDNFGNNIIVANENRVRNQDADPYYTNSTHLPVGYTDDIFTALTLQDELQSLYTGGTVIHGFLGERVPSIESTKLLVKRIAENFHLPYYTITPTFSICPVHGYLPGEHEYCPKCDAEMSYSDN